jgi:mycothiol synthase
VNVRPIVREDAEAIAHIAAADEEALRGRPSHIGAPDVLDWLSRSELPIDSWLFEEGGAPVAAGWFSPWGEKATFAGVVSERWKGRGIGSEIVDRAESRARGCGLQRMHTWVPPEDDAAVALFAGRGYREVRRFYDMAIELESPPPAAVIPDGLVLDAFREEDARAFNDAIHEAFRDHWEWSGLPFEEWWELRKSEDHSLWFVVRDGDEIAAAVRNESERYGGGYVAVIGVRRAWRGRGLAKALLHRTFGEFWERGIRRVTLGVDAESPTGATKLYESVGMHVESVNVVYEK